MSSKLDIKVEAGSGGLVVRSPYRKAFVSFARMRGGKWSDSLKAWLFDARDEIAVRSALYDIYGTDDYAACQKCDLRVNLSALFDTSEITRAVVAGWTAVERLDSGRLLLPENVVLVSGGFSPDGWIRKVGHRICADENTVLELRAIPVAAAKRFMEKHPEHAQIVGDVNIGQLRAERESLAKRLTELDQLIELMEERQSARDNDNYIIPDLADDDDGPPEGSGR